MGLVHGQMTVVKLISLLEKNERLPCPRDCPREVIIKTKTRHQYSHMFIWTACSSQLHCLNLFCRFTYWWSNAGTSTLGSVHHSDPWPSLLRTSGEHTDSSRLCSSLSSTIADLTCSLSVQFSQPVTTAHHYEPDHTSVFKSLGHIFRKEDVF